MTIKGLTNKSERVRARAAYHLAHHNDELSISALSNALDDPSPRVRRQVAYALGIIGHVSAIDSLIKAIKDPDLETRRRIAFALGRIGHTEAIMPLMDMIVNDDVEVGHVAKKAIIKIGQPAIPILTALYKHSDAPTRGIAVQMLGRIGDVQAIDVFIEALSDSDKWIRWMVSVIVRSMPDKRFIEPLVNRLDDEFMRWGAARSLGYVGDEKTIEVLNAIVKDSKKDQSLRGCAESAIKHIRERQKAK